jgi:hypothetical protein
MLGTTLAMYLITYVLLTAAYVSVVFYMARKAAYPGIASESRLPHGKLTEAAA